MRNFTVTLEARLNGSACGTASETVRAESADAASAKVLAQARRMDSAFTFAELIVTENASS